MPGTQTGSLAWEVVSQEERLEIPEDYYRLFTPAENALLDSTTAEGIGACELGPLRSLAAGLAPSGSWTGQSRVARAYRAGLSAFLVLEGAREVQVSSPSLSLRNRFLRVSAIPGLPAGLLHNQLSHFSFGIARTIGTAAWNNQACHTGPGQAGVELATSRDDASLHGAQGSPQKTAP